MLHRKQSLAQHVILVKLQNLTDINTISKILKHPAMLYKNVEVLQKSGFKMTRIGCNRSSQGLKKSVKNVRMVWRRRQVCVGKTCTITRSRTSRRRKKDRLQKNATQMRIFMLGSYLPVMYIEDLHQIRLNLPIFFLIVTTTTV